MPKTELLTFKINTMIKCFIHGSCRFNPNGEMGYAYIINFSDGKVLEWKTVEENKIGNTSIVADYKALNSLLEKLIELKFTKEEIIILTDSTMINRQFNGYMKKSSGYYLKYSVEADRLWKRFFNVKVNWLPKSQNLDATLLASSYY